jgi:rhamnose transport system permease protein
MTRQAIDVPTAPAPAPPLPAGPARAKSGGTGFPYWHELALLALLAGLLAYAGLVNPRFLRLTSQINLASKVWELAILALPMTLIIITAGIDLSVGATMALSAVVLGMSWRAGVPIGFAAALAVTTGLACGLLNGWFVAYVRVHPLIVTLATLSAYRGLAEGISSGEAVSKFPVAFADISKDVAGLPIPGVIFAVAAIVCAVVLAKTPFGRAVYAMGFNETACRFSGIPTKRIKLTLYALSGLAAGVAATLFVARRNTAKADVGDGMELDVITAVVLGGTSIFGGRGRVIGTVLGILLIHETREFVNWHWRNNVLIMLVIGVLLILSVLLNTLLTPRARRE